MRDILMVLAAGLAPGLFWLWRFWAKDRIEPEPAKYVIGIYFWGMLGVFAAVAVQLPLGLFVPHPLDVILVAPISEETLKLGFLLLALRVFAGLRREFDEPMDGIVYAAAVALGFASLENVGYMYTAYTRDQLGTIFALRAILSVPGHVLHSAWWGYAVGMTRFSAESRGRKVGSVLFGLLLSIVSHGVFNGLATISTTLSIVFLVALVVFLWLVLRARIRRALKASPHLGGDRAGQIGGAGRD